MRFFLLVPIYLYRWVLKPLFSIDAGHCRFYPSCSDYAILAVKKHGISRGGWLAARRLGCCHPFHEGGYDPVPEKGEPPFRCCHKNFTHSPSRSVHF